ncbi:MAG: hypothetical protein AAF493_16325 [Pseudomonadota bacterium]
MSTGKPFPRQRGAALLAILTIALLVGTSILLGRLSARIDVDPGGEGRSTSVLNEAKAALLAWSSVHSPWPQVAVNVAELIGPGPLFCPDLDDDGIPEPTCGPGTLVGKLPWRTLGLGDVRDGAGERLWYAVSPRYRIIWGTASVDAGVGKLQDDSSPFAPLAPMLTDMRHLVYRFDSTGAFLQAGQVLNVDNDAVLSVALDDGDPAIQPNDRYVIVPVVNTRLTGDLTLNGAVPGAGVAALIFAPGEVLDGQNRPSAARADYLEAENAVSPQNGTFDAFGGAAFNDRVVAITDREIRESAEERVLSDVSAVLRRWSARAGANDTFPWAAPFAKPDVSDVVTPGVTFEETPALGGAANWTNAGLLTHPGRDFELLGVGPGDAIVFERVGVSPPQVAMGIVRRVSAGSSDRLELASWSGASVSNGPVRYRIGRTASTPAVREGLLALHDAPQAFAGSPPLPEPFASGFEVDWRLANSAGTPVYSGTANDAHRGHMLRTLRASTWLGDRTRGRYRGFREIGIELVGVADAGTAGAVLDGGPVDFEASGVEVDDLVILDRAVQRVATVVSVVGNQLTVTPTSIAMVEGEPYRIQSSGGCLWRGAAVIDCVGQADADITPPVGAALVLDGGGVNAVAGPSSSGTTLERSEGDLDVYGIAPGDFVINFTDKTIGRIDADPTLNQAVLDSGTWSAALLTTSPGDEYQIRATTTVISGLTDAGSATNVLVDSTGVNFVTEGVQAGDVVWKFGSTEVGIVESVTPTQLNLRADFPVVFAVNQGYEVALAGFNTEIRQIRRRRFTIRAFNEFDPNLAGAPGWVRTMNALPSSLGTDEAQIVDAERRTRAMSVADFEPYDSVPQNNRGPYAGGARLVVEDFNPMNAPQGRTSLNITAQALNSPMSVSGVRYDLDPEEDGLDWPAWLTANRWTNDIYFAVAPGNTPNAGANCFAGSSCIAIGSWPGPGGVAVSSNDAVALIVSMGPPVFGQNRALSGDETVYLEGGDDYGNATTNDDRFSTNARNTEYNDRVRVVEP